MKNNIEFNMTEITPEYAHELLARNKINRPISLLNISRFVHDIKNNNWKETAQPIQISTKGNLLDGQHRCLAVIESGKSIHQTVAVNCPEDSFDVIDTGKIRNAGDTLAIMGVKYYTCTASAIRTILLYNRGYYTSQKRDIRIVTNEDVRKFYKRTSTFFEEAHRFLFSEYKRGGRLTSLSRLVAFYFLTNDIDENAAEKFIIQLATGENLTQRSPILAYRNKIIDFKVKNVALHDNNINRFLIKTWNFWRKNKSIKVLRLVDSDDYTLI